MPRHEMLNNIAHKDLRIITRFGAEFGDNVGTVLVFPTEFLEVQREYPIFFRKDPAGSGYQSIALLGFEKNENLFLNGSQWEASYLPGVIARGPFLIGFQEQEASGEVRREPVIHVDVEHPRVSRTEGELVFMPQGGNTPYLDHIAKVLGGIKDGIEVSNDMFNAFTEFDLIESVDVEVKPNREEAYSVKGLYSINQQKLASLDGASLEKLNKSGFLQGAFLVIASMHNVRRLMGLKQRRRAQAAAAQ